MINKARPCRTALSYAAWPFVILLLASSQSLLLTVSCTRTFVTAARGVEVVGHGERDAARKIVGVLTADDISAIKSPPLTITLGQVRGLEEEDEAVFEERLTQPRIHSHKNCRPTHRFIAIGVAIEVEARHPPMRKDEAVAEYEGKRGMTGAKAGGLTEEQLGILNFPKGMIPTE